MNIRRIMPEQTRALRASVLRAGRPASEAAYACDADVRTVHFGALEGPDAEPFAVATMHADRRGDVPWRLRGMATRPDRRGNGAGRALVAACAQYAEAAGTGDSGPIWCNARVTAQRFYERCGFVVDSAVFDLPPIGAHCVMVMRPPVAGTEADRRG